MVFIEINQKVEAVEKKYQTKLSHAEDDFGKKLKEKEKEYENLVNRKDGVRKFTFTLTLHYVPLCFVALRCVPLHALQCILLHSTTQH